MADAVTIKHYLEDRGLVEEDASYGEVVVVLDDLAGRECARLEAVIQERDRQIERLTEALVALKVGVHMLDLFKLKRS
jgi:hypothetical protein